METLAADECRTRGRVGVEVDEDAMTDDEREFGDSVDGGLYDVAERGWIRSCVGYRGGGGRG